MFIFSTVTTARRVADKLCSAIFMGFEPLICSGAYFSVAPPNPVWLLLQALLLNWGDFALAEHLFPVDLFPVASDLPDTLYCAVFLYLT